MTHDDRMPPREPGPARRIAIEMAAGIAHEFNNMLASLVGLSDLMRSDPRLPAELVEDAERIHRATLVGAERVRHIQKIAGRRRPTEGLGPVVPDDLLTSTAAKRIAGSHRVEVGASTRCRALGDPAAILEILDRLVDNAIEAMPDGGTITLSATEGPDRILWAVSDDGPGIAADVRRHVCEPFFTTHAQRRGRGLGLAIALGLAESLGGTLRVADPEQGARIEFELARVHVARADDEAEHAAPEAQGPGRVLIVDDDATIRDVLARMVRMDGHEALAVDSGERALEELARSAFDVVVTDLGMPGMDGAELARAVKLHDPRTVVVMASGWLPDDEDESATGPVSLALAKPIEYETFSATLARAMALRHDTSADASIA